MAFADFYSSEIRDETTALALQTLYAQLRAFVNVSFSEDGQLNAASPSVGTVPIGGIQMFAGTVAPATWLLCDGTAVNRVAYQALFNTIGVTYGPGDGSTTFNLPDLRQRFPLGKAAAGTGAALGATGGTIDHTHSVGSHTHSVPALSVPGLSVPGLSYSGTTGSPSASSGSAGSHAHSGTTERPSVNGAYAANSPENIFATNLFHVHDFTTSTDGSHSHSISVGGSSFSGTTGGGTTGGGSTGTGTTGGSSGSTDAANPPFVTVNYIILAGV